MTRKELRKEFEKRKEARLQEVRELETQIIQESRDFHSVPWPSAETAVNAYVRWQESVIARREAMARKVQEDVLLYNTCLSLTEQVDPWAPPHIRSPKN